MKLKFLVSKIQYLSFCGLYLLYNVYLFFFAFTTKFEDTKKLVEVRWPRRTMTLRSSRSWQWFSIKKEYIFDAICLHLNLRTVFDLRGHFALSSRGKCTFTEITMFLPSESGPKYLLNKMQLPSESECTGAI